MHSSIFIITHPVFWFHFTDVLLCSYNAAGNSHGSFLPCPISCYLTRRTGIKFSFALTQMLQMFACLLIAKTSIFQTIVTGAGDETLRFWNVFPSPKSQVNDFLVDGENS